MHLVFNIYGLWIFGTIVERALGRAKTAGFFILPALGSNSLDFALAQGCVGRSGIGYGLFGPLWVLSNRDKRFRDTRDSRTATLFVGLFFFFCIFATATHVWNVANVAHGAIALPQQRLIAVAGVVAIVLFGLFAAPFERPRLNFSKTSGYEEEKWGYEDLKADHHREALRWQRDAVVYQPNVPGFWSNLGIAYSRLGVIRGCPVRTSAPA